MSKTRKVMNLQLSFDLLESMLCLNQIGCKIRGIDAGVQSIYGNRIDVYIEGDGLPDTFKVVDGQIPAVGNISIAKDENGNLSLVDIQ